MTIDLPTLMIAGGFVSAISGVFLIFAWLQARTAQGMLWWAAANLTLAVCVPLIASPHATPGAPSVVLGLTFLNLSPALIWAAARATNAQRVDLGVIGASPTAWILVYMIPAVREAPKLQLAYNLAIVAIFIFAAALEFWRARADRLTARSPLIVLLVLHGIFSTVGAIDALTDGPLGAATIQIWFGFVHFETLAFIVGTSIFTVALARERSELLHKIAANTDSLTGLATRRAFYERAENVVANALENDTELAVVLFDLDSFKAINDTFGHGPGDEVLKAFGQVAMKTLRSTDLIGRLGGEEFGAILPGADIPAAVAVAERIRLAFTNACRSIDSITVQATVSAGVARADRNSTVDSLVKRADAALYRAKTLGRDRVEIEAPPEDTNPPAAQPISPVTVHQVA